MNNRICSSVLAGKLHCRSCKIHNNLPALALVQFRSLYIYKSIDKHPLALFLLSENRNLGR
jgi:hypothetical protein